MMQTVEHTEIGPPTVEMVISTWCNPFQIFQCLCFSPLAYNGRKELFLLHGFGRSPLVDYTLISHIDLLNSN